jgi:3-phenylpropionate/trans-cinnamate dioxygenase ferredoxin subunit
MDQSPPPSVTVPAPALPGENESICLNAGGWSILLCRSGGALFAVENRCTHLDMPLAGGRIRRGYIFCPHHGARFALASGAAAGPPATEQLRSFACRESPAGLVIELPSAPRGR